MYNIEINFLKDRGLDENLKNQPKRARKQQPIETKIPLIIGGSLLVLLPLAALGYLSMLNGQKTQTQADIASMENEIKKLSAQQADAKTLQQQLDVAKAQRQALVTVFDQIKPVSVILQEISDLTPAGVQINNVQQDTPPPPPQAAPAADGTPPPPAPIPPVSFTITGFGRTHNDVNDLLIMLKGSEIFNPDKTILTSSQLVKSQLTSTAQAQLTAQKKTLELPQVTSFVIKTELSDKPASQMLQTLASRGALGLVTRIKQLQQIGAIETK